MDDPLLRALIVDDEPIARKVLREELEAFPEVQVIGEAADGKEALRKISALRPDLVFLDLQMPVLSGMEVVRSLGDADVPHVVIVTAFDDHAIQAFEAGAIDYLLKPVREERLRLAVERAKVMVGRPAETSAHKERIVTALQPAGPLKDTRIIGRNGADYHVLDPEDVLAFQADRELVWIVTAKQRLLSSQSLRAIEERRNPLFQRVHRNAIVNVNHIRKMTAMSSQRWLITLSNALQLVVSKRQAHTIREILHWR